MADSVKSKRHDGLRVGVPAQFAEGEIAESNVSGELQLKLAMQPTYLVRPFAAILHDSFISTPSSVYRPDGFL